eukprot:5089272-Prymnesium_polylepis.1
MQLSVIIRGKPVCRHMHRKRLVSLQGLCHRPSLRGAAAAARHPPKLTGGPSANAATQGRGGRKAAR